jgi:GNAT superfamily N-acetyltransferase
MSYSISEIVIPASIDSPDAKDFVESIRVGNAVEELGYGTDELAYEPSEELAEYRDPHHPYRVLVAKADGRIVGRGVYETQLGEGADSAWLLVQVLPEHRRQGIGTALADGIEAIALGDGRAKALAYTPIQDASGPRLNSPTGFGSVPMASTDARFLLARGYRLEQVERASRLPLPIVDIDELVAAAQRVSGDDYRLHFWTNATPQRWHGGLAELRTRMSTDAPSAGLEEPEDVWTAARVEQRDERNAVLNPRDLLVAAVEHVPTGRLVGFTELSVPVQPARSVAQYATLVLSEHRGHRLGMLLKVGNLAYLQRVSPGHPSVTTFNAEENRHMLGVNESVGFVPFAYESAWRKDLGAPTRG